MQGITSASMCPVFLLILATLETSDDPGADPRHQQNPTIIHRTYKTREQLCDKKLFEEERVFGSHVTQCAAHSRVMRPVSQRGPCNLFSLLRSHIIIVVCIMFIIISIIVRGIYVMFMIIVYRLKPGSFCRLRAYGSLVFVWAAARLASQYCFPTLKCECEI